MSEEQPSAAEPTPAPAEPKVFNIDARRTGYEPLRVIFRGQEYVLGRSAAQVLRALTVQGGVARIEGESQADYTVRLLDKLPAMTGALCPEIPSEDWTLEEQVGLFNAVSEVLGRIGRVRFPTREG